MKSKYKIIALIISIIFHILLLFFFGFYTFHHNRDIILLKSPKQIEKEIQKKQAALWPKKSDTETLIVFDDKTFPTLPTKPITKPPTKPAVLKKTVAPTKTVEPPKPVTPPKPTQKIIKTEKPSPIIQKPETKLIAPVKPHFPEKQITKTEKPLEQLPIERLPIERLPIERFKPEEKVITQEELKKFALANLLKPQGKESSSKNHNSLPASPSKTQSLASSTKCFLDSEKGNSCMLRSGENKFPSLEEMKYICYEKQIEDHIISTWKVLFANSPLTNASGSVSIPLVINSDGSIDPLELIESSGDKDFDHKVMICIKKAAPFPSIPRHFGVSKYRPRGVRIMLPTYYRY